MLKDTVKFVIVTKGPLTIAETEELRPEAIKMAKEGLDVPVLMTCGDERTDPLTTEDMIRIREMIDTEIAWVRIGNKIAHLIIAQI